MLAMEPLQAMAFAADKGLKHYLKTQYADQTFRGLYHWNPFDAALLVPYFLVMIVLALYGIHRYTMCYHYFKYPQAPQSRSAATFCRASAGDRPAAHLQ